MLWCVCQVIVSLLTIGSATLIYLAFTSTKKTKPKNYNQKKKQKKKNFTKIQCEYCKATILLYHKEKHLTKCSTKKQQDMVTNQLFYDKNINFFGDYSNYNFTENKLKIHVTENKFIEKLLIKYNEIKARLRRINIGKIESFNEIKVIYLKTHKNKKKMKHCKQIELIIYYICNRLKRINFSKDNYFLFELGAGKASLGAMFHRFIDKFLVIIDINNKCKAKEDNRLKNKQRIQCGLQHLNLNKLEIKDIGHEYIAFSKHLCGNATDFGLRCIVANNHKNNSKFKCKLIGIALCCRTLCSYETYCNIDYLLNDIKLIENKYEFDMLKKMSQWGIDNQNNEKRNKIGSICRRLMDEGRVQFLIKNGFNDVKLIKYCCDTITLENILLLAS